MFGFHINSYWGPRLETPAQIAKRCRAMLDALAGIHPAFNKWIYAGERRPVPFFYLSDDGLAKLIEEGVHRADDGDPTPIYGYLFSAYTGSRTDPLALTLSVNASGCTPSRRFINVAQIETQPLGAGNETLITSTVLKAAMLAVASAWDVTWAAVYPAELLALWTRAVPWRPSFRLAWITYLSPRFAPMVTPPRGARVEYTPQGGIVMTATLDRFDIGNELHLAAARRIEQALAPVNALPWPPDARPAPPGPAAPG